MNWAVGLTFAATIVLVGAEWSHSRIRYFAKPLASAGFVTVGILALDLDAIYGVTILAGLMLGAAGDVALLGRSDRNFMIGLGAFLAGHIALTIGFVSEASTTVIPGVLVAIVFSAVAWRWLGPHVAGTLRTPVIAYVAVITLMLAAALGAAPSHPLAAIGGSAFVASDLAVARDRFVSPGIGNRLWGLPLYYLGQVLIALSG
ncbi:MAG: lysoplasmalogenase [Acidimicrobiia bacterium]|nr:lysoplasmalogenase [Acidimicrobiia bacterium]